MSPRIRTASSAYQRKNSAEYSTSPRASAQGLAVLRGDQQRQLVGPIDHQLVGPLQDLRPLAWRRLRPRLRGGRGGVDAGDGVLDAAAGHRGEDPAGGGIDHLEGRAVRGRARCSPPMISWVGTLATTSATTSLCR